MGLFLNIFDIRICLIQLLIFMIDDVVLINIRLIRSGRLLRLVVIVIVLVLNIIVIPLI